MTAIDTVVFDMGGVFLDWDPRNLYRKVFDDANEMDFFLAEVCNSEWNLRRDAGSSFAEGIDEIRIKFPQYVDMAKLYLARWPEMIAGLFAETLDIASELKHRKVPLYLLSNCATETFSIVLNNYDFPSLFDGLVISGDIHMIKPDPSIYHYLLTKYALLPDHCLFVDDQPRNVEAAESLGFAGHRFREPKGLRQDLIRRGLL